MTLRYALPMLALCLTLSGFFAIARGRFAAFGPPQTILRVLVALPLLLSGIFLHFFRIADAASIIPPGFPDPRVLVQVTGLLEVAGAVGLFLPAWQRRAALALALLMIAIFPANIYAAGRVVGGVPMPGIPVRLTMQILYILLILLAGYGLPGKRKESTRPA